jgi:hypothetical protein
MRKVFSNVRKKMMASSFACIYTRSERKECFSSEFLSSVYIGELRMSVHGFHYKCPYYRHSLTDFRETRYRHHAKTCYPTVVHYNFPSWILPSCTSAILWVESLDRYRPFRKMCFYDFISLFYDEKQTNYIILSDASVISMYFANKSIADLRLLPFSGICGLLVGKLS